MIAFLSVVGILLLLAAAIAFATSSIEGDKEDDRVKR